MMLKFVVPRVGQLGQLDLAHCDRLTNTGCTALVERCAELTDLNLTNCAKYVASGTTSPPSSHRRTLFFGTLDFPPPPSLPPSLP